MRIEPQSDRSIRILEIPLHLAELFKQITNCSELSSSNAEGRLFPSPASSKSQYSKTNTDLISDWKAYVQPELDDHFRSHRSMVESDLRRMQTDKGTFTLSIPPTHIEAWIGTLNQVRLAIAATHNLQEADVSREEVSEIENKHDLAILRVHFYGYIQQRLIEEIEAQ
ncbi:MAG: DUF2017 family protein [Chthoniobacterales bacterium]